MSEITRNPAGVGTPETADLRAGERQALCCVCGATRYAKASYLGRGTRTLRCEPCRRATTHAAVTWEGTDQREESNRQRDEAHADDRREHDALVSLFAACHIELVGADDDVTDPESQPEGGLVDIVRWLSPEGYLVRVRHGLSITVRLYCLDWAWRILRPSIARWDRYPVRVNAEGQAFQHLYNDELEIGIYELCR